MKRFFFPQRVLFCVLAIAIMLGGCKLAPTLDATPTATDAPDCASRGQYYSDTTGVLGNQYQLAGSVAGEIYARSLEARNLHNDGQLSVEKSKAAQFLAYETQLWSHINDIYVGENGKVRVVMTFISPELVYAVLLNHVIYGNIPLGDTTLSQYVQNVLNSMDDRHEYLVLASIRAELPDQTAITVDLSGEKVVLKPGDEAVPPAHYDNSFHQSFSLTTGQRAGLFYFPFQVKNKKQNCRDVMDTQHDQAIPLAIAGAKINDQELQQLDFSIPFVNPLGVVKIVPTPNPNAPFQLERYAPMLGLPAIREVGPTGTVTGLTADNLGYWQDMGQFVWATLTSGYFSAP